MNTNRERGETIEEKVLAHAYPASQYEGCRVVSVPRAIELVTQALKDAREERDGRWRMAITHLSTAQRESVLATLEGYEELLKEREASLDNQPK